MSEYSRIGINPDTETDKLGSRYIANGRYGDDSDITATNPQPRGPNRGDRKQSPSGSSVEGLHGVQESQRIAADESRLLNEQERAVNGRGLSLARQALKDATSGPTAEQMAAAQSAEGKRLVEQARQSWQR